MSTLPLLPATVIGSWSFPGWYAKFGEDVARQPERFGAADRDEAVRDGEGYSSLARRAQCRNASKLSTSRRDDHFFSK